MKKDSIMLVLLILVAYSLAAVIGATNQERIRWKWHDNTVLLTMQDNEHGKVEFGLRNDGVVVWREIKPAVTNSPAEQVESWRWFTNGIITNWTIYPTNIIIYNGNTNSTSRYNPGFGWSPEREYEAR